MSNSSSDAARSQGGRSGVSRRGLLIGGASAVGGAVVGGGAVGTAWGVSAANPAKNPNDVLFVNGKIHTYDTGNPVVSSARMKNGRWIAVGDSAKDDAAAAYTVDLGGRTVIPGIIDSHNHIALVSNRPGHWVGLEDVFTHEDVVARLTAKANSVPAGEIVTSLGPIVAMQFPGNVLPPLATLNAVPRPVMIMAEQGGNAVNQAAVDYFASRGITIAINATGYPTGTGVGLALQYLRTRMTDDERERNALAALQYYSSLGITTHLDEGAFHVDSPGTAIWNENSYTIHRGFLRLNAKQALPARIRFDYLEEDSYLGTQPDLDTQASPKFPRLTARLKNAFPFYGSDMMRSGGIGEFAVSGFGGAAAAYGGDYWLAAQKLVAANGWRNENHSLTTTDVKAIIDGYAKVDAVTSISDLRWVVAHVPFITKEYVDKAKALGLGLKVGWGPTRTPATDGTPQGPIYRDIVDSGIHVAYHSDGGDITAINPWLNYTTMVTGKNLKGDMINPNQALTRDEVIQLSTANCSWFIHEDDLGVIKVGNHADLAVLNQDFYSVSEDDMRKTRSELTVVGGDIVYDRGTIAGDRSWAADTANRYGQF